MSGLNWSRRAITAKIESVVGQDAVPLAADGVIAYNVQITPLQGDVQEDDLLPNGMLGGVPKYMINKTVGLEFEIDWVGNSTPGDAPGASAIYRACGFAEVISAGVDVAYSLVSESEESASIYWYLDGHLHRVTGFKGSAGYAVSPEGKLRLKVSGVGDYNAPQVAVFPTVTFTGYQKALKTNLNTIQNFSLHSWTTGHIRSIEVNSGSDIQQDILLTKRESVLASRAASGSIVLENPDFGDKDWFAAIAADDIGEMNFDVNEGAGRIVEVRHPQVQLLEPSYDQEKNRATLTANLNVIPDRTNQVSEFNFTFK